MNKLKQVSATILSNVEIMPGVHTLWVEAPDIASIAVPGQFVMIRCGSNLILRRPLSIHQIANSKKICFLFAVIALSRSIPSSTPPREVEIASGKGEGTLWLSKRQSGETLDLLGPLGKGFSIDPKSKKLLLVAGGIGIAPLAFLAQQASTQGKSVTLLLGARTASVVYPHNLLPTQIQIILATEDGSEPTMRKGTHHQKGKISDFLTDYMKQADQIFACGPLAMYQAIADLARQISLNKNIQVSLETRMGCGISTCYGCSIKTRYGMQMVCHHGPVFNLEEIIWQEVKL